MQLNESRVGSVRGPSRDSSPPLRDAHSSPKASSRVYICPKPLSHGYCAGCRRIPSPDFLEKLRVCGAVQATMPDDIVANATRTLPAPHAVQCHVVTSSHLCSQAGFFFGTFAFIILLCSLKVFVKYSHGRRKRQLGERLLIKGLQLLRILPPDPPDPTPVAGIAPAAPATPAAGARGTAVLGCEPQAVSSTGRIAAGSDALFNAPSSTARQVVTSRYTPPIMHPHDTQPAHKRAHTSVLLRRRGRRHLTATRTWWTSGSTRAGSSTSGSACDQFGGVVAALLSVGPGLHLPGRSRTA